MSVGTPFACLPSAFDTKLAVDLGNLIEFAYAHYPNPPAAGPGGLKLTWFMAGVPGGGRETFGFVTAQGTTAYVVFRGTKSLSDWLANVDFKQEPFAAGWGNSEKGFTNIYKGCDAEIQHALNTLPGITTLVITGHSLGGSVATLCAATLHASKPMLYTFASPRVGDLDFATAFNAAIPAWRIVNTEDIVNTVPLATPMISEIKAPSPGTSVSQALQPHNDFLQRLGFGFGALKQHIEAVGTEATSDAFERTLGLFSKLNYMHIGESVSFSQHNGSIVDNHAMTTYLAALAKPMTAGAGRS